MKYIKCDRCGQHIGNFDGSCEIEITTNFEVNVNNFSSTIDLCKRCTEQFFTHFMNNHYFYKENEEKRRNNG